MKGKQVALYVGKKCDSPPHVVCIPDSAKETLVVECGFAFIASLPPKDKLQKLDARVES